MRCWGPELGFHKHLHREMNGIQAWRSLLKEIYGLVKSYGDDKVVILNAEWEPGSLRYADPTMLESYILTHVSTRRWHDWKKIQDMRKQTEAPVKAGTVILALSYAGYTSQGADEDAFNKMVADEDMKRLSRKGSAPAARALLLARKSRSRPNRSGVSGGDDPVNRYWAREYEALGGLYQTDAIPRSGPSRPAAIHY